MRPALPRPVPLAVPLVLGAVASGALPATTSAEQHDCVAPEVVGVDLAMARQALSASGCATQIRQLPGHGRFVTPSAPDERQLVGKQRPDGGAHTQGVTLWLEPLCRQAAAPGPESRGPSSEKGPTELIAGLFLEGGPLQTSPRCRQASTAGGTLTIATTEGQLVASRTVRPGSFGVFPLRPGRYVVSGSLGAGGPEPQPRQVTVAAHRATRLNLVAPIR